MHRYSNLNGGKNCWISTQVLVLRSIKSLKTKVFCLCQLMHLKQSDVDLIKLVLYRLWTAQYHLLYLLVPFPCNQTNTILILKHTKLPSSYTLNGGFFWDTKHMANCIFKCYQQKKITKAYSRHESDSQFWLTHKKSDKEFWNQ